MEEKKTLLSYKPGTILQGVYKSYGRFGFLITDDDHEDVYISDRDHLNAVNNDTVEVKTMKSETGRHNTEGRVMKVLERANDTFVCTYEMLKDGGEAVPIDEKVDMYIEIPEGQEMDATTGARVIVEVTRWPGEWTDAEGRVTEVIGYKGDKGLDIDIIVAQHRLPHEFSERYWMRRKICRGIFRWKRALPISENSRSSPSTGLTRRIWMMRFTARRRQTGILSCLSTSRMCRAM